MKKVFPFIVIVVLLLAGGFYLDRNKSNKPMADSELKSYSQAPEFAGINSWLNSDSLTMRQLRGKVVLIDFWTYSCINCIRTMPYVTGWYEKYKDRGLVVVGVHTPEFAFEKDRSNVQTALKRHKINYPVAQDNDYATWNAYNNRYWPAHYLIDQQGQVVYTHFGEGKYQETEQAIQDLLGLGQEEEIAEEKSERMVRTPEIYFGQKRLDKNWMPKLEGQWTRNDESVMLISVNGKIMLNFYAKDVHMVAQSQNPAQVKVFIDGQLVNEVEVKESQLYTLFEGADSDERTLQLEIQGRGFEAFTFTFG